MQQKSLALCTLLCLFGGITLTAACTDNQIGRPCNSLTIGPSSSSGVRFVNPAPDCPSRLCMVTPPPSRITAGAPGHADDLSICTADCNTDDDCATADEFKNDSTRCTKYVCGYPSVVPGADNFCCRPLCMCADDLIPGFNKQDPKGGPSLMKDENGVVMPTACRKDNNPGRCQLKSK